MDPTVGDPKAFNFVDDRLGSQCAGFCSRLANGGQGGICKFRHDDVVETYHRYILRQAESLFHQLGHDANGRNVIVHKHSCGSIFQRQEVVGQLPSVFVFPASVVIHCHAFHDQRASSRFFPVPNRPLATVVQRPAASPLFQRRCQKAMFRWPFSSK